MTDADLESFYEKLAAAIDEAGPENAALFLSKLALLLAREVGDGEKGLSAIDTALKDLG
jgi:hypothetical protein